MPQGIHTDVRRRRPADFARHGLHSLLVELRQVDRDDAGTVFNSGAGTRKEPVPAAIEPGFPHLLDFFFGRRCADGGFPKLCFIEDATEHIMRDNIELAVAPRDHLLEVVGDEHQHAVAEEGERVHVCLDP